MLFFFVLFVIIILRILGAFCNALNHSFLVYIGMCDEAKQFIIDSAYDPTYGARPLKRFIQSKIETLLARSIIGGNIEPESTLEIDCKDGTLIIK